MEHEAMGHERWNDDVDALASLADPTRRALYIHVAQSPGPIGRDAAAEAVGVKRSLAAYHLDRLAGDGILEVSYARPAGRTGPGAGRPAKFYSASRDGIQVSLPPREYAAMASLLADAVEDVAAARERCVELAATTGRRWADETADDHPDSEPGIDKLVGCLTRHGYRPVVDDDKAARVVLANCPFVDLAEQSRELVCGINLELLDALRADLGVDELRAELRPEEGRCCVVFTS